MKRRIFLRVIVLLVCLAGLLSLSCRAVFRQSGREGKAATRQKIEERAVFAAKAFDLSQVHLLDGPFKDAMERDRKYLHQLEPDRFLHTFRLNAGLGSSAEPYGGWESPNGELRGHSLGHYLSACALMYASAGDEELKKRGDYIVSELAKCQRALGDSGYLSAYPESFIDRVEAGRPVWAPWYTLHKIYAGLIDMYLYCDNGQALDVVKKMARWAKKRTDRLSKEHMQKVLGVEFGGMNGAFANLYAITGEADHLELAKRFDHKLIYEPLAEGKDELQGLHSNTQVPKIVGAAREYEMTGEKKYYDIATFFWDTVIRCRMYSVGGTSNFEWWRTPPCIMAEELSVESAETCCTYNMLKLTRHLFQWSADVKYADYYERAIFNQILASQSPENGMMMYYIAMKPGHFKIFNRPFDSFWCCTGTGMENHAKYGDSIYFYDDEGLYVNLFIASELNWQQRGLVVRQDTRFGEEESTKITIKAKKPVRMNLRIRIPYWVMKGVVVKINGETEQVKVKPSSYMSFNRLWKDGDIIEVTMPMSLHFHHMPDDVSVVSFMYGPLVLAGQLGTAGLTEEMQYLSNQRGQHDAPSIEVPQIVTDIRYAPAWVMPVSGEALTFRTVNVARPKDVTLMPFYKLYGQRYNLYWKLYTERQYQKMMEERRKLEEQQAAKKKEREQMIEERMIDSIEIGDESSEKEHNLRMENSFQGMYAGGNWRDARDGGWFSYDMKVEPDKPMVLECTYWGSDAGRQFEILINDVSLGTVEIEGGHPEKFFEKEYKIPLEITKDKTVVTVKFKAPSEGYAGGTFGLLMLRGWQQ